MCDEWKGNMKIENKIKKNKNSSGSTCPAQIWWNSDQERQKAIWDNVYQSKASGWGPESLSATLWRRCSIREKVLI